MGYSNDERKEAVKGLVQGTLSFPRDKLGPKDSTASYEEVAELARSAFLYDPDSIYYAISLAAGELNRIAKGELATIDELLDAMDDLSQPNKPIETITPLVDARVALNAIDGALSRNGVVGTREISRYESSMNLMKRELGKTTKMTYVPRGSSQAVTDVVRPGPEASAETALKFKDLKTKHTSTKGRARQLLQSFSEYVAVDLASKVGSRQISRASDQLQELHTELNALGPYDRTAVARQSLLKVLANQAVVKGLVNRLISGEPKLTQKVAGTQKYRMTASGEGTAPYVEGTVSAPWKLIENDSDWVGLNLNGSYQDIELFTGGVSDAKGAARAELLGTAEGDFSIQGDLDTPWPLRSAAGPFDTAANGATFHIWVDGVHYEKLLTSGAAVTSTTLANDINNSSNWTPSQPEITASDQSGKLQIAYNVTSPPNLYARRSMEIGKGFDYIQDLWPWDGAVGGTPTLITGFRSTGWDANDKLWIKVNDDPSYVEVDLPTTGSWPNYPVSSSDVASAITSAAVSAGEDFTGYSSGDFVGVRSGVYGEGSIITIKSEGLRASGGRTGHGYPSYNGMKALGFSEGQEIRRKDVGGQAVINILNNNSWFKGKARATLVRSQLLSVGRGARSSDTVLTVPVDSDPTGTWPVFGELKLVITGGDNSGIYQLTGYSWVAGTLTLNLSRRLRDSTSGLLHQVKVYREVLKITSSDASTTGRVQMADPADSARSVLGLDNTDHRSTIGSVFVEYNDSVIGWKAFDLRSRKLKVTDKIVKENGDSISEISAVGNVESGIIGVSPEVASTLSTVSTGFSIISVAQETYESFEDALTSWVSDSSFEDSLTSIDKKLSPLLLIHPTKDRVDQAYNLVSSLKSEIEALISICSDFSVAKIKGIDRSIRSFADRGHDRARDLLLEGEVTKFFNTTAQTASYSGYFVSKTAEAVVQDLNESNLAKARYDADLVRYAGSYVEDVDPQYDFSDFEDELQEPQIEEHWQGIDEGVG